MLQHKIIVFILLLASAFPSAMSQQKFDAIDYAIQVRQSGEKLDSAKKKEYYFFNAGFGAEVLLTGNTAICPTPFPIGHPLHTAQSVFGAKNYIAVGRWLTPTSGVRLGLNLGSLPSNYAVLSDGMQTGEIARRSSVLTGIAADYLFNISAFGFGHNTERRFELLAILGIGYNVATTYDDVMGSIGFKAGLQAKYNISPLLDLFVEPQLNIYSDNINRSSNLRGYDASAALFIGFNYKMVPGSKRSTPSTFYTNLFDNLFFSFSAGGQSLVSPNVAALSALQGWGPSLKLSIGKHITPVHSVRLSFVGGNSRFMQKSEVENYLTTYGVHADYMFDMNSYFAGYQNKRPFTLYAIAGLEAMATQKSNGRHAFAPGIGFGFQAKYALSPSTSLFFEPRVSYYTKSMADGASFGWGDMLGAVHLGVTYNIADKTDRLQPPVMSANFFDNLYVSGGIGVKVVPTNGNLAPIGRITVGKEFSYLSEVRLSGELGNVMTQTIGNNKHRATEATLYADYLLNLSNLLAGYSPTRDFALKLIAGANVTYRSGVDGMFYPGINLGAQLSYAFNPALSVFVEPMINIYGSQKIFYNNTPTSAQLYVGVNYYLPSKESRTSVTPFVATSFLDNTFVSLGVGGQMLVWGDALRMPQGKGIGPSGRLSVGKWFSPIHGTRLSLSGGTSRWRYNDENPSDFLTTVGGNIDYMLNLSSALYGYDNTRLFELIGLAGVELTGGFKRDKANINVGIGAGLQAKFRVSPALSLYLEPRLSFYPANYAGGHTIWGKVDASASLLAGVSYRLTPFSKRMQPPMLQKGFLDNLTFSIAGGANLSLHSSSQSASKQILPTISASVSKRFTHISSLRLKGDIGLIATENLSGKRHNAKISALSLDYLFSIPNILVGYNPDRKFDVLGVLGAGVNYRSGSDAIISPIANLGLQLSYNVAPAFSIFAEPMLRIHSKNVLHDSNLPIGLQGAFLLGVSYHAPDISRRVDKSVFANTSFSDNLFVSIDAGARTLLWGDVLRMPQAKGIGFSGRLSLGKWITPIHGVRLSLRGGYSRWDYHGDDYNRYLKTIGLDVDYMMNLHSFFFGYDQNRVFELIAIAGIEGLIGYKTTDPVATAGIGVGFQTRFRVSPSTHLYLEPRLSGYPKAFGGKTIWGKADAMLSAMAGVSYTINNKKEPIPAYRPSSFVNRLFVSVGFGTNFVLPSSHLSKVISPLATATIGVDITHLSSVRLQAGVSVIQRNHSAIPYKSGNLSADYMLNLSNLLAGYLSERPLSLYGFVGVNRIFGSGKDPIGATGANIGLHGAWNITPEWSLFVEPQMRFYNKNTFLDYAANTGVDMLALVSLGVTYNLNSYVKSDSWRNISFQNSKGKDFVSTGFFTSISGGVAQMQNTTIWNSKNNLGVIGEVAFGKQYTAISSWRVNFSLEETLVHRNLAGTNARIHADYMLDLTRLFSQRETFLKLKAFAGVGYGALHAGRKTGFSPSLHGGFQIAVPIVPAVEIYIEPHATLISDRKGILSRDYRAAGMAYITAGITYNIGKNENAILSRPKADFSLNDTYVYAAAGANFYSGSIFSKRPLGESIGFNGEIGVGKWITSLSGVRLNIASNNYALEKAIDGTLPLVAIGLDYTFNLTSALTGYDPERKFQIALAVGPSFVLPLKEGFNSKFGGVGSINISYRVLDNFSVFVEPKLHIYPDNLDNDLSSYKLDASTSILVGGCYHF